MVKRDAIKEELSEHNDTEPEKPKPTFTEPLKPQPSTFVMQSVGRVLLTLAKKEQGRWPGLHADASKKQSNQ